MKKQYISSVFIAVFAAVLVFPGVTSAAAKKKEDETKKPASASCSQRLVLVNGHAQELEDFKNRHYGQSYRNISDPKIVEVKQNAILADGSKSSIRTGRVKASVYQKGGVKKDLWVKNYDVILQRHEGALAYLSGKLGESKTTDYKAAVNALGGSINSARIEIDGLKTKWNPANANCANKAEGAKVKVLADQRIKNLNQIKKTRDSSVNKKSVAASQAYQKTVNNKDNKKVLRPRPAANNGTGGAVAPSN